MNSSEFANRGVNRATPNARMMERTIRVAGRPIIAGRDLKVPAGHAPYWLSVTTLVIITLGVLREFFVRTFGFHTPLKDLGQIALDSEGTLAVWFSSLTMMAAAALLFFIGALARKEENADAPRWMLLGLLFALMSLDETVSFHETTMAPLRNLFGLGGALHFSWVIIASPIMLGLSVYFLPFLARLPWRYAAAFVVSGLLYVGGALGMEFVGGYLVTTYGMSSSQYMMAFLVEESLEMIGLVCFLTALLSYLKTQLSGHTLNLLFDQ